MYFKCQIKDVIILSYPDDTIVIIEILEEIQGVTVTPFSQRLRC